MSHLRFYGAILPHLTSVAEQPLLQPMLPSSWSHYVSWSNDDIILWRQLTLLSYLLMKMMFWLKCRLC